MLDVLFTNCYYSIITFKRAFVTYAFAAILKSYFGNHKLLRRKRYFKNTGLLNNCILDLIYFFSCDKFGFCRLWCGIQLYTSVIGYGCVVFVIYIISLITFFVARGELIKK